MNLKTRVKNSVIFLFVAYLGVVSVIISALILSRILGIMDISEIGFKAVLLTWGSMVCGLCIIPGVLVKKMYKVTVSQLGLGKIKSMEIVSIAMLIIATTILLFVSGKNIDLGLLIIVLIQNIGVAFSEEFFTKGVLYYIAGHISGIKIFAVTTCALVFAFLLHGSDSFYTNLFYRLPMGIVLGIVYLKSRNIYIPVCLHIANNLLATSVIY